MTNGSKTMHWTLNGRPACRNKRACLGCPGAEFDALVGWKPCARCAALRVKAIARAAAVAA